MAGAPDILHQKLAGTQATAKQSQFKEAALLAQETAAAEEEGESQVWCMRGWDKNT